MVGTVSPPFPISWYSMATHSHSPQSQHIPSRIACELQRAVSSVGTVCSCSVAGVRSGWLCCDLFSLLRPVRVAVFSLACCQTDASTLASYTT